MFPIKDNIPTDRFPVVTVTLIALNVIAYFFWQKGGLSFGDPEQPRLLRQPGPLRDDPVRGPTPGRAVRAGSGDTFTCSTQYGARYDLPPTWLTVFTAMFMHGGLLHLGGNMLFLWIFGNNVEDSMGPFKFIVFYLLGGLAAVAGQLIVGPDSTVPNIGASGAIAAVLGGYIVLFPKARVVTIIFIVFFFTILELPAMLILGFWFIQQALFGYFDLASGAARGGGVAYFAHIGGFLFGLAAIKLFADERKQRRQQEAALSR